MIYVQVAGATIVAALLLAILICLAFRIADRRDRE